jgi:hypothetical protein
MRSRFDKIASLENPTDRSIKERLALKAGDAVRSHALTGINPPFSQASGSNAPLR